MKIANKISLSFLVTAVILTGISAPVFYIIAKKSLEDRIYAHLETTAQSRAHHIETYLEEHKMLVEILASDILLQNTLKAIIDKGQDSTSHIEYKEVATVEVVGAQLKEIIKTAAHFHEIKIINPDGKIVISTETNNIGLDKSTRNCFLNGRKELYIEDAHFCGNTKEGVIAIATPILRDKTKEILGVLVASVFLESLNKITTDRTGMGETGEIYLVNKDGFMITPSRFKEDTFLKQKVDTLNVRNCRIHKDRNHISRKQALTLFRSYRGTIVLGTHAYIPEMQWYLCSEMDEKEALAPLAKIKFLFVIILIFVPIAAWLTGIFLSRVISRPIHKLQIGAEIIGRGNLNYKVGTDTKDEIGQLSQAFDKMSEDLKESHLKLKDSHKQLEKKVQERTAELSSTNTKLTGEIAERKHAEDALRESEGKLSSMLQSIGDHMSMLDKDFNILWANETAKKMFGNDIIGKKCYEVYHRRKEPCDPSFCPTLGAFRDGKIHKHDNQVIDKEGKIVYFHCTSNVALRDKGGKPAAVLEISRNITEHKKAEEELKQSREFLNNTINALDDPFFAKDEEHRWTVLNDAACKVMGRPREELIGKTDYDLFAKEQADVFWERDNLVLKNGITDINEEEITWHGKLHTISTKKSVFTDSLTGKKFIVGTIRDITERKKAEEELKQSREFLNNTINALDDTFFVKDEEHRWTALNDAACKAIGHPREELIGKSDYELFPKEQADVFWEKDNLVLETGETNVNEEEVTWDGKLHTISTKKSLFKDSITGKRFIVGTARDITERKQAEEALRQSEERFRQFFQNEPEYCYMISPEGVILNVNIAALKALGYRKEELVGKHLKTIYAPESHTKMEQLFPKWKKTGRLRDKELVIISKTGEKRTVLLSAEAVRDKDGKVLHSVSVQKDISERKYAEEALRESEQKYRALVEQSLQGIAILQDYRIVFANTKAAETVGCTTEDLLAFSVEDMMAFVPPEDRASTLERLRNRFAGKAVDSEYEIRLVRKNGDEFWLNLFFSPIKYDGKPAIQLAFVDITKRKQIEQVLRRSEKRFREIFENTSVGVYRTTPDGQILMANPALVHMLGYSSFEELSQRNLEEEGFEPQYQRPMFKEEIERKGRIVSWESIWTTRDGKALHVIENARAVQDEDGKLMYYEGTAENIDERKKAEETLIESEQRFRAIFEQAADSIVLIDVETEAIVEFNDRTHKNLGYTREEFQKLKISDIEVIESAEQVVKHLGKIIRKGADTFETKHRRKDGEIRDIQISSRAISIREKDFVQSIWHDITERMKVKQKLLEHQEQLKSLASQLTLAEERERRRIATELHDEISQSLFISKMKVEALEKPASNKKVNDTLEEISDSLGRIIAAMRSLTFDLSSPILYEFGFEEAVAEWLNEQVEKKHGIGTEFEDDGLPKQLDDDIRVLLFRNVRELLINAIKHAQAKKIKVSIRKVDSRICVTVEDDGVGFDYAKAESMVTNKEAFGLFSIQERLEHFGGNLDIDSAPGCGCRVTITSPLKRENMSKGKQA